MIERHLAPVLLRALRDTPVVYLQGARQTGKSTLVRAVASKQYPAKYLTLDSAAMLSAAQTDPEGFIAGLERPVIIDEAQRAPELFRAIKAVVDQRREPGQFILTGSTGALALPRLSESLAGRVELLTLRTLSQGELQGRQGNFIDRALARTAAWPKTSPSATTNLTHRMLIGGYPEAVARPDASRRNSWFDSYISTILHRDVRDLANIERTADLPRLLRLLASRVGGLLNYSELARALAMPQSTLKRYVALLQATFLVHPLPPWSGNLGKRWIKSSKLLLTDTGLLGSILGLDELRLGEDPVLAGHVLENFVAMELLKQCGWSDRRPSLFHWRTDTGQEVDFVLEEPSGKIVGIEVKHTASIDSSHFKGLRALADQTAGRFVRGIVLYTGAEIVPFAKNLWALPVPTLWS